MFAMPKHVLKRGEFMIRDYELERMPTGTTLAVQPAGGQFAEPDFDRWLRRYYSIQPENIRVGANEIHELKLIHTPISR
jgi:formylmethanofuran dehydrogenase subunit A